MQPLDILVTPAKTLALTRVGMGGGMGLLPWGSSHAGRSCMPALAVATLLAPHHRADAQEVVDTAALQNVATDIGTYADALARTGELSGTLLVALEGRPIYERAFGMASYELDHANTVATLHGVGSVTKLLTAIAALKLADEGAIRLDGALSEYVPGFPRGDEITLEHLLRHSSGLPHRVTTDGDVSLPRSAADMVELASEAGLRFEPGSERGYSSAGYSVLARVLEIATGKPYGRLLQEEVFGPAGALHSRTADGWNLVAGGSDDYLLGGRGPVPAQQADLSFLVGAGSVFSTPGDLLAVTLAVDRGVYGDLVRAEVLGEEGEVSWNGQSFGYRAFVDYRARDGFAVVFAGNLHTGAADLLRRDVPRLVAGEQVELPRATHREAVTLDASTRAALSGVYQFRAGQPDSEETLRFAPDGSHASLGGWVLVPISADRFASTTDYGTVDVVRREDGTVGGLEWSKGDASFVLPRAGVATP